MIEVKETSAYVDEGDYLTKITPNTTIDTLKDNLENDEATIKVFDKDGNALARENLATGDKVQLIAGDTVLDERVIVVLGDTSGDGKVRAGDATKVLNQIIDADTLTGAYAAAADASGDGRIRAGDATKILNHITSGATLGK